MKVRMKIQVTGTFHGRDGAERGEVIDWIPESYCRDYIRAGIAEEVVEAEERAVLEADPKVETAVVPAKRVGRPKKTPEWHDENAPGWNKVESDL